MIRYIHRASIPKNTNESEFAHRVLRMCRASGTKLGKFAAQRFEGEWIAFAVDGQVWMFGSRKVLGPLAYDDFCDGQRCGLFSLIRSEAQKRRVSRNTRRSLAAFRALPVRLAW